MTNKPKKVMYARKKCRKDCDVSSRTCSYYIPCQECIRWPKNFEHLKDMYKKKKPTGKQIADRLFKKFTKEKLKK